jgi:hypothetical protein
LIVHRTAIDTFRPLSQKWHEFLGLASYRSRGQKHRMQSSSDSGSVYIQPQVPSWRADATIANNGVRGWGAAIGMLREQSRGQDSTGEGSHGGWYFGGNGSRSEQGRHVQDDQQTTSILSRRPEGELPQYQGSASQTTLVL